MSIIICYDVVIYKAFFSNLNAAQGRMNGVPNETRTPFVKVC